MTYSVKVENGIVTNRIRGTADGWIETDVAQIDWSYDGSTFSPPPWDRSNAPSVWHDWVGDKDTRIGDWVERTEEKAEYERKQAMLDADTTQFETVLATWTGAQIVAFVDDAFPDPKQNKIIKGILKHMAVRT